MFTKQNLESALRHSTIINVNGKKYYKFYNGVFEMELQSLVREIWDKYHDKFISIRSHVNKDNEPVLNIIVRED